MRRIAICLFCLLMGGLAWGMNFQDLPPAHSTGYGLQYSPRYFTAEAFRAGLLPATIEATFPTDKLLLSGGDTANYTTDECIRVMVFRSGTPATIYDPTMYRFNYVYPTLEVSGVLFNSTDIFRVEFMETNLPTNWAMKNITMTSSTETYPLTFEAGSVVMFSIKARNQDIKWLESNSLTAEFTTIGTTLPPIYNQMPILIPRDTIWWFATDTIGASLEAVYGYKKYTP